MKSQFIEVDDDLVLHYEETGQGDTTVLLVPGWTMSTRVFERQFEHFRDTREFRLLSYDPRAQGLSSKTRNGHDYPQHGRDLHHFIEALGLDRIVLGGWSFGCLETLAYINQFGASRLAGLIMIDGPPRATGEDNESEWVTYRRDDSDGSISFFSHGRLHEPDATNREFAAWMLEDESRENLEWVLEITRQTPDEVAALLNDTAVGLDYEADLRALEGRVPLWYLMRAGRDGAVAAWANANTPTALVQAYGEHLMFWERAERFNRDLGEFVSTCPG